MATPTRSLVQAITAHKPFTTTLSIEQTINLTKMFKVDFPKVKKMVIKNTLSPKQGGFRHFTAHYLPSIKYYNQQIEFSVVKPRESYKGDAVCGVEVTFEDDTTKFVPGTNVKSHLFLAKLVSDAHGKNYSVVSRPPAPQLSPPVFFKAEGGDTVDHILPKLGYEYDSSMFEVKKEK